MPIVAAGRIGLFRLTLAETNLQPIVQSAPLGAAPSMMYGTRLPATHASVRMPPHRPTGSTARGSMRSACGRHYFHNAPVRDGRFPGVPRRGDRHSRGGRFKVEKQQYPDQESNYLLGFHRSSSPLQERRCAPNEMSGSPMLQRCCLRANNVTIHAMKAGFKLCAVVCKKRRMATCKVDLARVAAAEHG